MKNLKVSVKDGKACEKVIKVEVPQERINQEYSTFYKAVAPKAKIPGFRPGKAPQHVLEMHYKDQARESVLKELITESYQQAVQEQSIEPLGYPEVEDVNFADDRLSYKAKVEIRPRVKLSRVTGLKAKKGKVDFDEKEIEESLKRVRESMAQYKAVEDKPAAMGHYVIADYVCECEGKEIDSRTGDWFELDEEKEFLKGFSKQIVGAKLEEQKEIKLTLPEGYSKKEYVGKEATFKVTIKEIKEKALPELNDEFVKSLGGEFKTVADLKEKIKGDIVSVKEREVINQYERALLDELLKHNKLDLPERLVKRREDHLLQDAMKHYQSQGIPEDSLKEMTEKMREEFAPEAKRQVHLAFVLEEIVSQQKISVTDEDRKKKFESMAAQVHQPVEAVEQYYASNEERRSALDDQIRSEKAVQYIKDNAKEK